MSKQIHVQLCWNTIAVSPDGKSALPADIRAILEPNLRYQYRKLLRGQDAYAFDGTRRPIQIEIKLLYMYDKYGRLVCGAGLMPRVMKLLTEAGLDITTEDVTSVHQRVNRYTMDWDNLVRNFQFRAKQDLAITAIADSTRGIIDAPTGFGKSFLFKALGLLYTKARIVITTKRKDLVEATRIHLSKDLPNIGQVGGGMNKPGRITVCTADSLHKLNPEDVDILIGEEVHELAAPTYSTALVKFKWARMFGFSGSPTGRMDNADMKLESLFGPVIFHMSYQEAVNLGLVVPIQVRWIDINLPNNPAEGLIDVPRQRHGIWRNEGRNERIAQVAREFAEDEQVLIMVTTFDHAVALRQFLPEFTLCYAERSDDTTFNSHVKNGRLPEDEPIMTGKRRQELRQKFERGELKKVIATDVWSTGVSFDSLAVMIRADARSSEIMDTQMPGRVCRLHTDKPVGLVIDCLDQFDSGFRTAARKRQKNYEAKGWAQEKPGYGRRLMPN